MRALFVYKYLTLGGVEAVLRARLEGLPACGVEAQAWFLQDGEGRGMFAGLEGRVRVGGLEALRSFLAAERFDAVSVIDTPEVFPLLGGGGGPRVIVEAHTPYLENLEYLRALDPAHVAACWAPSQHQREVALRRLPPGIEVRVVPNALPRAFLEEVRPFEPAPPRSVVAWVGRLDALKNWRGFVEIAGRIGRALKDVEFWMAGDSSEPGAAESLFRAAWRAGIAGRLYWYRALPHERAPRWLDAVRDSGGVLISTSRGESFGMAVAEAVARACPVVAPALGPFPELIEHGETGLLYRAGSASAAAAAVRRLLGDAGMRERCGAGAREQILRHQGEGAALAALAHELKGLDLLRDSEAAISGEENPVPQVEGSSRARMKEIFSGYYSSGFWPGPGSTLEYTESIRREIPRLIRRYGVTTILDAPCGDSGWFSEIPRDADIVVIGADIVPELVAANQARYGDARTRFVELDISRDPLPSADLWLCRDCLFHFSEGDILRTLRNFARSDIPYLLTSTHPECQVNTDVPTGGFRLLNLERPPYSLGAPIERVEDWIEGHPVRQLALWERKAVAEALGALGRD